MHTAFQTLLGWQGTIGCPCQQCSFRAAVLLVYPSFRPSIQSLITGTNKLNCGRAGDIITKKRNRLGVSAAPLRLVKSRMGLPEVENWEIRQVMEGEEVDV